MLMLDLTASASGGGYLPGSRLVGSLSLTNKAAGRGLVTTRD